MTEIPPCTGVDCAYCAQCVAEGWTCRLGTLTGEEVDTYLGMVQGMRAPNGFWAKQLGVSRGLILLRFAVQHIAGITIYDQVLERFNRPLLLELSLDYMVRNASIYSLASGAFPEFGIMPWELGRAPRGFWKRPGAEKAALQWFLDKQGWTLRKCADLLRAHPPTVYVRLIDLGLTHFAQSVRIYKIINSLDPLSNVSPPSVVWRQKQKQQQDRPGRECPWCYMHYLGLKNHVRKMHPEVTEQQIAALPKELAETWQRRSRASRLQHSQRQPPPHLGKTGIIVPDKQWGNIRWVALDMEEWSEALEVRPLRILAGDRSVRVRAQRFSGASICVYLPVDIIANISSDVVVRTTDQGVIALRFRSDDARSVVWQWYQQRSKRVAGKWQPRVEVTVNAVRLYRATHSLQETADHFGVSLTTINCRMREARQLHGDAAKLNFPLEPA